MNTFCHIAEFDFAGYQALPVMLYLSDQVVVWSPSARQLQVAYDADTTILRPGDIVELVQDGHLQVIGRKHWLTDPASRATSRFEYATWVPQFDGVLSEIAIREDNAGIVPRDRHVRIAHDEPGYAWADQILSSSDSLSKDIVRRAKERLKRRAFPVGTLEKIEKERTVNSKLRVALRDVCNHREAFLESSADLSLEYDVAAEAISELYPKVPPSQQELTVPSMSRFREIVELLASVNRPRNAENLKNLLKTRDRSLVAREFGELMKSQYAVSQLLAAQIAVSGEEPAFLKSLLPTSTFGKIVTVAGLALGFATFQFTAEPIISLIVSVIGAVEGLAEKISIIPASSYRGPRLPFIFAYGTKRPRYRQIKEMHRRLLASS